MFRSRFLVVTACAICATLPVFAVAAGTSTIKTSTSSSTITSTTITTTVVTTPTSTTTPPNPSSTGALSTVAQTRITNLTALLSNREDGNVRRLQNVTARLESRLALLKSAGKDVSVAEKNVVEVKSKLEAAKASLNTIDKAVATFVGSSNPRESWSNLRATYTIINSNLRAAFESLKAAVTAAETATETLKPVAAASSTATSTKAKQ